MYGEKISRRRFAKLGGAAFVGSMISQAGLTIGRSARLPLEDSLRHIAPELREAAAKLFDPEDASHWTDATFAKWLATRSPPPVAPRLSDIPVETVRVPVGPGQPEVTLFVINGRAGTKRPGYLHIHGGGYVLGSANNEVAYEQQIAKDLDCVVVSVEYRLALETRYQGMVAEIYAGLGWMHANHARLGLDVERLAVMGESAGGGLAATLAIMARDRREVPLCAQILIYPMLDDRTGSTMMPPDWIGTLLWTRAANRFGWRKYLGQEPGGDDVPAMAVPARAADLSGLPPTFIGVGSVDLFVDEDIAYGRRLIDAGVPTQMDVVPGAFHAFDRIAPECDLSRRFTRTKMNALRRAFGQPTV